MRSHSLKDDIDILHKNIWVAHVLPKTKNGPTRKFLINYKKGTIKEVFNKS